MKYKILFCIALIVYCPLFIVHLAAQQLLMRDVFAAMPDSVAPLVTKNNRLDCIDFIENNMEAKVRNVLDEYVTLEALTADYARFRTSAASFMEMKLLPTSDSTSVLCLVTTAQTGEPDTSRRLEDSNIRFLNPDWTPLDSLFFLQSASSSLFVLPPLSSFLLPADSTSVEVVEPDSSPSGNPALLASALRSLDSFHPVRLSLSADSTTLTATLQSAYLARDEREAIAPRLRPLAFRWNGRRFELE